VYSFESLSYLTLRPCTYVYREEVGSRQSDFSDSGRDSQYSSRPGTEAYSQARLEQARQAEAKVTQFLFYTSQFTSWPCILVCALKIGRYQTQRKPILFTVTLIQSPCVCHWHLFAT
jgi:hypothetical protein